MIKAFSFSALMVVSLLLAGCEKTNTPPKPVADATEATPPNAASAAPSSTVAPTPTLPPVLPPSPTIVAITELTNGLAASTSVRSDEILTAITGELGQAMVALADAAPGSAIVSSNLPMVLKALTASDSSAALEMRSALVDSSLTPEQKRLAKRVQDAVAAFVVEHRFSEVPGARNEISGIVHAMRRGDQTTALQALIQVASKAQFTPEQKRVLGQLVGQQLAHP